MRVHCCRNSSSKKSDNAQVEHWQGVARRKLFQWRSGKPRTASRPAATRSARAGVAVATENNHKFSGRSRLILLRTTAPQVANRGGSARAEMVVRPRVESPRMGGSAW